MNKERENHPGRFYVSPKDGWLFGVCAGIADYFGFRRGVVRLLAVLSMIFFPPLPLLIYIFFAIFAPRKPEQLYDDEREEKFWQDMRRSPSATFSSIRYKFRSMEATLQKMEHYVTSKRFNLDQQFKDLES